MYSRLEIEEAGLHEFTTFLRLVWAHLGLPEPDAVQLEFAHYLQYGPQRVVIEAYRGAGKTWITGAYVIWRLFLDPQINIKIVSASQDYADDIATFISQVIGSMAILAWLRPTANQRSSALAFDVGPAEPDPTPSVSSVGMGGQITGNRADIIIADDVETKKNSYTDLLRVKLRDGVKEFESVLKPGPTSKIIYLGTPHVEETLYGELPNRGYEIRVWPSRVPEFPEKYKGRLGPMILQLIEDGVPAGTAVEPLRHSDEELRKREVAQGYTHHQMQYMLDPSPADANRFPLKTGDMLVWDFDKETTPIRFVWSRDPKTVIQGLASGGLDGDVWRSPTFVSPERSEFQSTVMCIDPSGKGEDETAYTILRYAQGMLYWVETGGFHDGMSEVTQQGLATRAILHHVDHVGLEPNFGGGAFGQLLKPWLVKISEEMQKANPDGGFYTPTLIEDMPWARGQKEVRILDTLEPVVQAHKIVVERTLIESDLKQYEKDFRYSVLYQLTHLTRDKGSLGHEDRIESLAMCVEYFAQKLARDQVKMVQRSRDDARHAELQKVIEICKMGGVMVTDNRIGHERSTIRDTMHVPCGNTPFDWRPGSGNW